MSSAAERCLASVSSPPVHAAVTADGLSRLAVRRRAGELDAAEFAALYFLHEQIARHGRGFASRRRKTDTLPRPDWTAVLAPLRGRALRARLIDYLERYQFRGVRAAAPTALVAWLRRAWPLELTEHVPSALEVLRAQARGARMVSVVTAPGRASRPVQHKPDAFAFFLHDLDHACRFFHPPALHAAQRAFFAALATALDRGVFAPYLTDPNFVGKFHYLIADMNTHPEHARQYLRAILIEFYLRRDGHPAPAPLAPAARRALERVLRTVEPPARVAVHA